MTSYYLAVLSSPFRFDAVYVKSLYSQLSTTTFLFHRPEQLAVGLDAVRLVLNIQVISLSQNYVSILFTVVLFEEIMRPGAYEIPAWYLRKKSCWLDRAHMEIYSGNLILSYYRSSWAPRLS